MADMRYFEWDYDNDTLTEFVREGECNGCGACCMTVIKWQYSQANRDEIEARTGLRSWNPSNGVSQAHREGVVTEIRIGDKSRYYADLVVTDKAERCPCLTSDKRCAVHTGKRRICTAWPMSPRHVEPFKECSYSFREIGRWKISEIETEAAKELAAEVHDG